MNWHNKVVCCITALCISGYVQAQRIAGKVVDETNAPLEFANIVLLSATDSAFVQGTISNEDGSFQFLKAKEKEYILKISSVGYQTVFKNYSSGDVGIIRLNAAAQMLGEAVVVARRPAYELKGGALTTNVQNSLLSTAGTANDVLSHIPGVQGQDGDFIVFGKGEPLIYINGKLVRDLSELNKLRSEDILKVELIANPGSEYDASVKAVLKIKTVKKLGDGFGASLSSVLNQAHKGGHSEQVDLKYRKNNLDVFAGLFFQQWNNRQEQTNWQTVRTDTVWRMKNDLVISSFTDNIQGKGGFNYEFNDNHSMGATYSLSKSMKAKGGWQSTMEVSANDKFYDKLSDSYDTWDIPQPTHLINAYYRGLINKLQVNFNTDFMFSHSGNDQVSTELSQEHNDRTIASHYTVNSKLYAYKLVLSYPLGQGSLQAGVENTFTEREDSYVNHQNILSATNDRIKETNMAAFAGYKATLGNMQLGAGIRYEHVTSDYYDKGVFVDEQSRVYDNIFPNLSLSYFMGNVQTQIGYTAKTARPAYSSLSSNRQYNDRFTYQGGNPLLKPAIIHDVTLNAMYKWMQFTCSYIYNKDAILYLIVPYEEDCNISLWTYRNFPKHQQLNATLSLSPWIGCWQPTFIANVSKQYLTVPYGAGEKKLNKPRYYLGWNNSLSLPKDFVLRVDMNYMTEGNQKMLLWKPSGAVNLSLYKSFFNNALTVNLQAIDIFASYRYSNDVYCYNIDFKTWNYSDTRQVRLTLLYNFNVGWDKYKGTGAGENEKSRL